MSADATALHAHTAVLVDESMPTRVSIASPGSVLPAQEVEMRLVAALRDLDAARKNAVIWFGEILSRKLYLDLGCSSIYHYAHERLGFSRARTAYFLRLCRSFEALPALKESVASGAVPWTKAREVVKVATPQTEAFWVDQAQTTGRRELERRVAATRGVARARRRAPGQGELLAASSEPAGTTAAAGSGTIGASSTATDPIAQPTIVEVPVTVSFQLTPEQYARYEAILEKARKNGVRGSREELLLAAWEMLTRVDTGEMLTRVSKVPATPQIDEMLTEVSKSEVEAECRGGGQPADTRGVPGCEVRTEPRYQIVIRLCEDCGRAEIATGRGPLPVAPKALETALCDARVHRKGEKNRATIPPSVRREVLARDGHRCRTAGCGSARFLDVHHLITRADGGTNDPDNLITLCAACHRMIHERSKPTSAWPLRRGSTMPDSRDSRDGLGSCPRGVHALGTHSRSQESD